MTSTPTIEQLQKQIADLIADRDARIASRREELENSRESNQFVIDLFTEFQEQSWALASMLEQNLKPIDPKNIADDHPVLAWRISEVLEMNLGNTQNLRAAKRILIGGEL